MGVGPTSSAAVPAAFASLSDRLPAVLPAAGVLVGAALAARASWLPVPLLVALIAAGLAFGGGGGGAGRLVAGAGVGLVAAAVQLGLPNDLWRPLDRERPVAVAGRVTSYPRPTEWGWRTTLRVERLAQGRWVSAAPRDLFLELPEGEPPPPLGARIGARGYAGRAPGYANRGAVGPGPWRLRVKSRRLLGVPAAPGPLARAATAVRGAVEGAWERAAGAAAPAGEPGTEVQEEIHPGPALVRALVLGDSSRLPPAWLRGLRRTGLSHLLAVSGLHVGLVAATALLAAAPLPRRARIVAALAAVGLYLLVAGPRPALLRASLMALAAGAAYLAGRLPSAGNALALAAAGLVVVRPELVADLGFGLTVAATAGLIFLAPPLARAWGGGEGRRGLRAWTARALAATVAAQLASAPLALPAFHLLAPASPLLNLVAVPWTALALAVCLAWCALALIAPSAAAAAVPLLDGLAAPFGWPALGPPQAWGTVALAVSPWVCLAAAALALLLVRPRRLGAWAAALALAGLAVAWGRGDRAAGDRDRAALTMFDVGQGDSLLLTGGPRAVLIDGGGWRRGDFGGRVLLPALLAEGVSRLDVAVLTHPDTDHCGGLVDLASYLPIGEVWVAVAGVGEGGSPCGDALAASPGVRLRPLAAGDVREVGSWRFEVLHPERDGPRRGGDNDRSLVLAAEALGRRVLLTGDVEAAAEREVAARLGAQGRVRFDLLKVAHHGSKTSTTLPLLAAVHPRIALVSAGPANPYGHPAAPVLARLERAGALVLRTDRQGEVRLSWERGGPLRLELPASPR